MSHSHRSTVSCTIDRTPTRTRIRLRHTPAVLPGPLTSPRDGRSVLRRLAGDIARRFNEARTKRGQIYFSEK